MPRHSATERITVTAAEFLLNPDRYQDMALTRPVVITQDGRERTVLLSTEEYARLKRRGRIGGLEGTPGDQNFLTSRKLLILLRVIVVRILPPQPNLPGVVPVRQPSRRRLRISGHPIGGICAPDWPDIVTSCGGRGYATRRCCEKASSVRQRPSSHSSSRAHTSAGRSC